MQSGKRERMMRLEFSVGSLQNALLSWCKTLYASYMKRINRIRYYKNNLVLNPVLEVKND